APEHPGGTIVTDSVTSDRLTRFLEGKLKLKHRRFKRGYKNVINEAMRLNAEGTDTPLAMETSGHGAMKENYFLDDGAYMAVKLCIAATNAKSEGNSMLVYLEGFEPPAVEYEVRIPIMGEGYVKYGKAVLEAFEKRAQEKNLRLEDTCEGVRISFPGRGWLLLRLSLHDPLLPLNVEGKTKEDGWLILDTVYSLLQDFDRLDLSGLNK
ncbi:phosphomannomutase/phosphoglucomutase, partial [Ruminococcaceae bacterium OttesenSCG-928-O06]|nr:phosphomannomutase/phosphoglucomutase [Ruminococcaceae bacterium OttesenSCG-928-O06]